VPSRRRFRAHRETNASTIETCASGAHVAHTRTFMCASPFVDGERASSCQYKIDDERVSSARTCDRSIRAPRMHAPERKTSGRTCDRSMRAPRRHELSTFETDGNIGDFDRRSTRCALDDSTRFTRSTGCSARALDDSAQSIDYQIVLGARLGRELLLPERRRLRTKARARGPSARECPALGRVDRLGPPERDHGRRTRSTTTRDIDRRLTRPCSAHSWHARGAGAWKR